MIDLELARTAFNTRAAQLVVATTGSTTLAATTAGYTRTTGSFVTDGFAPGMEITPAGFTQTARGVVQAVTATLLTIIGGRTAEASGAGRSLVVSLPEFIVVPNGPALRPVVNRQYLIAKVTADTNRVTTIPGSRGHLLETGLGIWSWYFVGNLGSAAVDRTVQKFKALFTPYTTLTLSDSSVIKMRGDVGVHASDPVTIDSWSVVTIEVPWIAGTRNAVAA